MIQTTISLNVGDRITAAFSPSGEIKHFYSFGGFNNESSISIVLTSTLVHHGVTFSENYYFFISSNNRYKFPKSDITFDVLTFDHKSNVITIRVCE